MALPLANAPLPTLPVLLRLAAGTPTYVDHAHVTTGAVVAVLGGIGLLLGIVRRLVLIAVLAAAVGLAGVVVVGVALHGSECTPGSQHRVCLSVHR